MKPIRRNFLVGMGSILQILPPLTYPAFGAEFLNRADADALHSDLAKIGGDFNVALRKADAEHVRTTQAIVPSAEASK